MNKELEDMKYFLEELEDMKYFLELIKNICTHTISCNVCHFAMHCTYSENSDSHYPKNWNSIEDLHLRSQNE